MTVLQWLVPAVAALLILRHLGHGLARAWTKAGPEVDGREAFARALAPYIVRGVVLALLAAGLYVWLSRL